MSNGLKVGILGVLVAALAFFGYTQWKKSASTNQTTPNQVIGNAETGIINEGGPEADIPKTTLTFSESSFDFGTIQEGDKVTHVFKVTNTGSNPLIISSAKGSCGCTAPDYPKDPIQPGETKDLSVTFNSAGKPGTQQKTVTVYANTVPTETLLTIKAKVEGGEKDSKDGSAPKDKK
jgi:hypothetical protein